MVLKPHVSVRDVPHVEAHGASLESRRDVRRTGTSRVWDSRSCEKRTQGRHRTRRPDAYATRIGHDERSPGSVGKLHDVPGRAGPDDGQDVCGGCWGRAERCGGSGRTGSDVERRDGQRLGHDDVPSVVHARRKHVGRHRVLLRGGIYFVETVT